MRVKSSNQVEKIIAKEEITHYEQFLLLPQCFQMLSAAEASESAYMQKRVILSKQGPFTTNMKDTNRGIEQVTMLKSNI